MEMLFAYSPTDAKQALCLGAAVVVAYKASVWAYRRLLTLACMSPLP